MHDLLRRVILNRRAILIGAAAVVVVSSLFIPRLKVNNFLLEDLPESDPEKQGFLWFEHDFGGVRPFEMEVVIPASAPPGTTIWDLDVLRQIEHVQDHLGSSYGIRSPSYPRSPCCMS